MREISIKFAAEFWLEFMIDEELKPEHLVKPLKNEAHELTSIFIISRKTLQQKNNN